MDALIQAQSIIYESISSILENWNKEALERRTAEAIRKRLERLDNLWFEFEANHKQLLTFDDQSHEYFIKNKYQSVHQFYSRIRQYIASYTKELHPSTPILKPATFLFETSNQGDTSRPPTPRDQGEHSYKQPTVDHSSPSKTEEMLRKQSSNFKALSRTINNIEFERIKEKWEFEDVLKTLQSRWDAIDSLHWELDSILDGSNIEYEKRFEYHEKHYLKLKKQINTEMWSVTHKEKATPQMEIPTFNGNYQHWTSFKDLFTETIHSNASLSNAQKMQFLKGKVRGEAEKLIQHLQISSDNYQTCWDILNHRYNNKKLIFSSHLNTLLSLTTMQYQTASAIKKIHDTTNECLYAIKNLGVDTSSWDPILVHLITQKLDADTHNDYLESLSAPRDLPNLTEFMDFLESKFTSLESSRRKQDVARAQSQQSESAPHSKKHQHSYRAYSTNQNAKPKMYSYINNNKGSYQKTLAEHLRCPHFQHDHGLYSCKSFLELQSDAKRKAVAKYNLCPNCLFDHKNKACISEKRCRVCHESHNTILHDVYANPTPESKRLNMNSNHVSQNEIGETLLATALVRVQAANQSFITLRALIDQGSQVSLITENAAQMLKLPRLHCKGVVFGIGAKENNCKGAINVTCMARHNEYTFSANVFVMRNVINNLPNKSFNRPTWSFLENIHLADPEFYSSRPVDLLLGADVYSNIIQDGIIRHEKSQPIAQQTRLGWILCGNVQTFQCNVIINNLEDLQQFWSVEDIAENSNLSEEDGECLVYYKETTTRDQDGRYVVNLPLQANFEEKLGGSKPKAVAQFRQLEKKFIRQKSLAEAYKKFIEEYQSLNHMAECTGNMTPSYYMPHHCVVRTDSTTSPVRVVYNGSAKTSTGYSLNDVMKRGPNLQQDLMSLILKWRQYRIAFTADIEKMFRQILVSNEHQNLQKIVWRDTPNEMLREYKLTTVTYGTKAAPFLAMMTLKQLAADEGHKYPSSRAAQALREEFYMDDLVSGSHDLESAKQLQSDLIKLLQSGGFNLRKWSSNRAALLENVNNAQSNQESFDFKQSESTKTLGLKWNPYSDNFTFQLKIDINKDAELSTKRTLLSDISKIFDPLGWLSPTTIKLKLLFKQVWSHKTQWDETLPDIIKAEWIKIRNDLQHINNIQIPRWYNTNASDNIELHGFCDASTKAYASVVYCKVDNKIALIAAKTRLVPEDKNITLPRLELCGAQLLAKLIKKVQNTLQGHHIKVIGWTDSTAVLGWIQGETSRWKPFVANRVRYIKDIIPPNDWRYVKSADNPADCASRGISAKQLIEHNQWWNGPEFLPTYNHKAENQAPIYTTEHELLKTKQSNVTTIHHNSDAIILQILNKYSNLTRAVRVLAWVSRVCIRRHRERQTYLTVDELERARLMIIKHVQRTVFEDEIENLQTNNKVQSKSKILSLNPFLDKDGLLRVGGRIKHANISKDMKHPLILPHCHHLTDLVIDNAHQASYHGGARLTHSYIRQKYWILGGNRAIKKRLHTCAICKKYKANKQNQLMGDLPESRTNPTRPFYHTGVDFTGFVEIKLNKGRGVKTTKGYIAVFVCMATKAVHLELVSDMSTAAFLGALRRMASRRGKPHHIYSDNGTNFVGANTELQRQQASLHLNEVFNDEFFTEISEMKIQWHFNAPAWPSAGGLWEAAVKSLKHHLRRVVDEQKLTFEEFTTILAELEGCLNSRPLCAITENPDDLDYLTPSHFLSSGPVLTIIHTEQDERTRWHRTQKIVQDIWKRWQSEYLSQLSARTKWKQPKENIQLGDVVVIHEPNLPVGKWALGRVTQLHPGSDGYVRVVTIKTKSGYLKRPVIKLTLLPTKPAPKTSTDSRYDDHLSNADPETNKQNTKFKQRKCNFSTLLMSFMLIMTMVNSAIAHYNITNVNKALYFDRISSMQLIRDEWKLIVYYDMNPYWEGATTFEKYIEQLNTICGGAKKKTQCDIILLQLHHSYDELKYYNRMLLHQHFENRRKRRGLVNAIGNIANSLFGVLDEDFAVQYQKDITLIRQNQKHLALLWRNQTSVVEAEYNLLKRTEEAINKQHKIINQHLINLTKATNNLSKGLQDNELMNELTLSTIIANNMLIKLKSIQDTLLETITDLHNGMFNIHLLSPKQLRDELNIISGQLPQDLSLPVNNIQIDMSKIYHFLKVKARITEQYMVFEIRIPLVSRENFDLYKVISIPQQIGNTTISIVPVSDHIAINLRKDTYLELSQNDVQKCTQLDETISLCHSQKPIFNLKSDDGFCIKDRITEECQTITETCHNNWTELSKTNMYLFYCCGQCALRLICENHITAIQVEKAGVIALEQNCVIKGEGFTVFAHKKQQTVMKTSSNLYVPEIAPINNIINVSVPVTELNFTDNTASLKKISQQIEQMKSETPLIGGITQNDVHQFTIIYLMMTGFVLAALVYIARWVRRRKLCASADLQSAVGHQDSERSCSPIRPPTVPRNPQTTRQEKIELKPVSNINDKATSPIFTRVLYSNN